MLTSSLTTFIYSASSMGDPAIHHGLTTSLKSQYTLCLCFLKVYYLRLSKYIHNSLVATDAVLSFCLKSPVLKTCISL